MKLMVLDALGTCAQTHQKTGDAATCLCKRKPRINFVQRQMLQTRISKRMADLTAGRGLTCSCTIVSSFPRNLAPAHQSSGPR